MSANDTLVKRLRVDAVWNRSCHRADMADHADKAADHITKLEADNARLREALHQIAATPNAGWMIARAALKENGQ